MQMVWKTPLNVDIKLGGNIGPKPTVSLRDDVHILNPIYEIGNPCFSVFLLIMSAQGERQKQ